MWTKFESEGFSTNVPFVRELLVWDGNRVMYCNGHGWDKDEHYFSNDNGKIDDVTHFMVFPEPPKV